MPKNDMMLEITNFINSLEKDAQKITSIEIFKDLLNDLSPLKDQPVDRVRWVSIDKVQANDYNPNSVANKEMSLLYTSISHDGYTQPIVTIYDDSIDKYIIVDGFHRYSVCKDNKDILERNLGKIPIVCMKKDINDRMASTVRHNRARGKHSVDGMASMVFSMLENGWEDQSICNELGMEAEELIRLKHITGFSKLFENLEFRKAWMTKRQILIKKDYEKNGR
tara:strand:- start:2936 stop:3604 length:669 start_codon:yes stop_codon:yes gene_type:complete